MHFYSTPRNKTGVQYQLDIIQIPSCPKSRVNSIIIFGLTIDHFIENAFSLSSNVNPWLKFERIQSRLRYSLDI